MGDIRKVVSNDLCVSCGICALNGGAEMPLRKGINVPKFERELDRKESTHLYGLCPGKGYSIVKMGKNLFNDAESTYDYRLGNYNDFGAATTTDNELVEEATSGGMMPLVANYLLEKKKVDGVLTVKFEYTKSGPEPEPFIATNKNDLILSQGSKYRPVPLLKHIDQIIEFDGTLAVIGTPCQIAGVRLMQDSYPELRQKIKFTIANFCGGYRDYRETKRIFDIYNVNWSLIEKFNYRGNGQPGYMRIKQKDKAEIQLNYPDYARLTGFIKFNRCRLCVDATGELADISFGDAWSPRFLNSGRKWSFFLSRSTEMKTIIQEIKSSQLADFEEITIDELVSSQRGNLTTKKERQHSRFKLYKMLGRKLPEFDGGYNQSVSNVLLELKVLLSHNFMYALEKLGIYLTFAKIIKRVKK